MTCEVPRHESSGKYPHSCMISAGMISDWPALEKWPHMHWWNATHGTRTVPLEIGRYGHQQWREAPCTISDFVATYMAPSIERDIAEEALCVQGDVQAGSEPSSTQIDSEIAYMAQHRIFDQIPELLEDVSEPALWTKGYEAMNIWMGTKGTVCCCRCCWQRG